MAAVFVQKLLIAIVVVEYAYSPGNVTVAPRQASSQCAGWNSSTKSQSWSSRGVLRQSKQYRQQHFCPSISKELSPTSGAILVTRLPSSTSFDARSRNSLPWSGRRPSSVTARSSRSSQARFAYIEANSGVCSSNCSPQIAHSPRF
jgi:hypothetical protein